MRRLAFCCLCLLIVGSSCSPKLKTVAVEPTEKVIDWQGHRGARGLLPENSIPAFRKALEYPAIRTLELDVVISADSQVVVSHEPWLAALFCSHPDGRAVTEEEEKSLRLLRMTLAEIQAFDCGSRGNAKFPEQLPVATVKPTLAAVAEAADLHARSLERPLPFYNIEIKSRPDWDDTYTPQPERFAELVLAAIK
ncbi:MAG: glycerophosphodiester phosphodiesterase family protein, partial [Bacteroidota bacterium]